ncbi:MAG: DUF1573 domain-containing protein [Desulfobacteraceae bacterium]|nr:DUF1573 domain-containing protein [Desulfobacteraceae bacterium]
MPPGGEGTITLRLNPKACSGKTEKSVLVTCNDPKKPYFILILRGQSNS